MVARQLMQLAAGRGCKMSCTTFRQGNRTAQGSIVAPAVTRRFFQDVHRRSVATRAGGWAVEVASDPLLCNNRRLEQSNPWHNPSCGALRRGFATGSAPTPEKPALASAVDSASAIEGLNDADPPPPSQLTHNASASAADVSGGDSAAAVIGPRGRARPQPPRASQFRTQKVNLWALFGGLIVLGYAGKAVLLKHMHDTHVITSSMNQAKIIEVRNIPLHLNKGAVLRVTEAAPSHNSHRPIVCSHLL